MGIFSLQASKVNLIITDYCMPGMTGYELLKKIKVTKPHPPLLIMYLFLIASDLHLYRHS